MMVLPQNPIKKPPVAAAPSAPARAIDKAPANIYDPSLYNVQFTPSRSAGNNDYSSDADVRAAQSNLNQYNYGNARGSNIFYHSPGVRKDYESAANRVALKKALAEQISAVPGQTAQELGLLQNEAGSALGSAIGETRKNYNQRGLLYSGMRQGAEQGVRGRVATALASGQAQTQRDAENTLTKQKAAFASIGLAEQEKQNQLAQQAFDQSYQNSIARRQAMQQLMGGVGQAAGYYANMQGSKADNPQNTQAQSSYQTPSTQYFQQPYQMGAK